MATTTKPTTSKSDDATMLVSLTSAVSKVDGVVYRVALHERVRSTHPLAIKLPEMFASADLSDAELQAARAAWLADRDAATSRPASRAEKARAALARLRPAEREAIEAGTTVKD